MVLEFVSIICRLVSADQLILLRKIHQQHADGVRLSDSGLFLLHGPESAVSSWVRFLPIPMIEPVANTSTGLVSVFDPDQTTSYLPSVAILKINGEKLLQIQDDGGFLK